MIKQHPHGIAIRCDENGIIRDVIQCHTDSAIRPQIGKPFSSILSADSLKPAMGFLLDIRRQKIALGCQLEISSGQQRETFQFVGCRSADGLLIIGAPGRLALEQFYSELTRGDDEQSKLILSLMQQTPHDQRSPDAAAFEELSKINNELTTLQRQLAKKNHQLETLNERKNQLLGMVVHDLRNPLGVIMAYAKFLEHGAADRLKENELQFIQQIENSSNFMLHLLEDLLDVSEIESGHLKLNLERFDFFALIDNNVKLNRELARQKNISIELQRPSIPLQLNLRADSNKLEQVLNNLIGNAIKYSHQHTQITVTVACEDKVLTLCVHDQGQGIPEAELGNLFKPFSTTSVRPTADEKSTGLGLVIAKKIIEGHGGQVFVESRVGEGSTFGFSLQI